MKNIFNIGKSRLFPLYVLSIVVVTFSCNDYLNKEPMSQYLSSDFYNNEEAIRQGTNGAYQTLYMQSGSILPFLALYDMYTAFGIERADNSSIGVGNINLKENFALEFQWSEFYKGIARCNTVLDGAAPFYNNLSSKAKQYLAEIKVIRAMHYHYLISLWGDIPLFDKSVSPEETKYTEIKSWQEVADKIINDIDEAEPYLPWQTDVLGRVDKSFALGLKARISLYGGSWCTIGHGKDAKKDPAKGKAYYELAAKTAKNIMDASGRSLHSKYAELFTRVGQLTPGAKKENIFSLIYSDQGVKKTHYLSFGEQCRMIGQSGRFPTQLMVDTYEMANGKRIDEAESGYNPKKPFENRDPRLKHTIYTQHDTIIGNPGGQALKFLMEIYNPQLKSFDEKNNVTLVDNKDYIGSVAPYGYIQSGVGFLWKKYNHFNDEASSQASYNILIMRYAEILLTYAEAKIELGELDASVYNAIDDVRARVGMPAIREVDPGREGNQWKMRQIVRRERMVELGKESLHFFDMRRWRIGALENAEPTYGYPYATGVDPDKKIYPDGYDQATPDMVPSYGAPGSDRDLNSLALYKAYAQKLRTRDVDRPTKWDDRYYIWPIPQTELRKAPWLTRNDGYGN